MPFVVPMTAMNARWNLSFAPEAPSATEDHDDDAPRESMVRIDPRHLDGLTEAHEPRGPRLVAS